jgi:Dullard-like phosphatase family protein
MTNPLKFDVKLTFTSEILQKNKDNKDISSYINNLLNKKINIHLKINLDKIFYQYQKRKFSLSRYNSTYNSEKDINLNNSIQEKSCDSIIELEKEITPKLSQYSAKKEKLSLNQILFNEKLTKKTLILDLDETLVYVSDVKIENSPLKQIPFEYYVLDENENNINQMINVENQTIEQANGYLIVRPGYNKFISEIKKYFDEIFIFTSSQYSYAEEIIKLIDKNKIISKIYSRKDCSFYNDIFYKDLNKIKKDLSRTIIVDNFPEAYLLQHFNGLPIPPFMGDPNDNELLKLMPILEQLSKVKDVRNYIRQIISNDGQSIIFNKAYELLNIKKDGKKHSNVYNIVTNKKCKQKLVNYLNNRNINSSGLGKRKLKISELMEKSNNKTMQNDSVDKIQINDTNNYFFSEKRSTPLSTIVSNNNFCKTISSNKSEIKKTNKKMKRKNLIFECLYSNNKSNCQIPNIDDYNNKFLYEIQKNKSDYIANPFINNNRLNQNDIMNSAKHTKSKSLIGNEKNLFEKKNTMQKYLNNSRTMNNNNSQSLINYEIPTQKTIK